MKIYRKDEQTKGKIHKMKETMNDDKELVIKGEKT